MLFQVFFRSDRPLNQIATAVGASVVKASSGAVSAKGAFERANACFTGLWWQIPVAAFAVGFQLQHGFGSLVLLRDLQIDAAMAGHHRSCEDQRLSKSMQYDGPPGVDFIPGQPGQKF